MKTQFARTPFNPSLREKVYGEFLAYLNCTGGESLHIKSSSEFFQILQGSDSSSSCEIDDFKRVFAQRIATFYLLKIRFLAKLGYALNQDVKGSCLSNPNSYFTRLFPKGSSSELHSPAMSVDLYTWYCPQIDPGTEKLNIVDACCKVSEEELQRIFSLDWLCSLKKEHYSHSFSHFNFGIFLNQLITELPSWLGKQSSSARHPLLFLAREGEKSIITTQYYGDYLPSLSLAHCLAQAERAGRDKGMPLICPDFQYATYGYGDFAYLVHELQFLASLVDIAVNLGQYPISFICHICRSRERSRRLMEGQQNLLGSSVMNNAPCMYDCLVLSLIHFPKSSPHHFLISKIQEKSLELKANGLLIVLSSKKLFIPSLADKIDELFKSVKLESVFIFDDLKGKGEVPSYIYVFSKRGGDRVHKLSLSSQVLVGSPSFPRGGAEKHSCLSFRISGSLDNFGKFSIINNELGEFFRGKSPDTTPLYHRELPEGFVFEFYQDAVVDGQLTNTTKNDTSRVTHPKFFKRLIQSSLPMGDLFQIDQIGPEGDEGADANKKHSRNLLGISQRPEDRYDYILILDGRNKSSLRLEFILSDSFSSKLNDYGRAYCTYFGLLPKVRNININLFHHFFEMPLGRQMIHLSLNKGSSRLRAKVASLLVPRFFGEEERVPVLLSDRLFLYNYSVKELLNYSPSELKKDYVSVEKQIKGLSLKYPSYLANLLVSFSEKLEHFSFESHLGEGFLDNNVFQSALLECPVHRVYPDHPDVYIQPTANSDDGWNDPLERVALFQKGHAEKSLSGLTLFTSRGEVASLYSGENLIEFLHFIFNQVLGERVSNLLENIRIPCLKDIDKLVQDYSQMRGVVSEMKQANQKQLEEIVLAHLNRD